MDKEYFIKNAHYIIIPPTQEKEKFFNYDDFLLDKDYSKISFQEKDKLINIKNNEHHLSNNFHYNILLPEIIKKLNINFSKEDFNILKFDEEDVMLPKVIEKLLVNVMHREWYDYEKRIINEYIVNENRTNLEIGPVGECYGRSFFNDILDDNYHKLFRYSHTPVKINNLNNKNGKKLVISCDSHMIPTIPILVHYYETVVVLDNRTLLPVWDFFIDDSFENCDCLCVMWQNNKLDQYIQYNLQ